MFLPESKEINKKQKDEDNFSSVFHLNILLVKSTTILMVNNFSKLVVFDNMTKKKIKIFFSIFSLKIVFLLSLLSLQENIINKSFVLHLKYLSLQTFSNPTYLLWILFMNATNLLAK